MHFVSASCAGEYCTLCRWRTKPSDPRTPATHKVGEEILHDDPHQNRHNLTAYVCCACFRMIFGPAACGQRL